MLRCCAARNGGKHPSGFGSTSAPPQRCDGRVKTVISLLGAAALMLSHSTGVAETPEQQAAAFAARESKSKQAAVALYPDAARKDTPLFKAIAAEVERLETANPAFFNDPDWPMMLAAKFAAQLGIPPKTDALPTLGGITASSPQKAKVDTAQRLEQTIFPSIDINDATLTEIIAFVNKKSGELDPSGDPIEIVLDVSARDKADIRIKLSMANVPALELLRYVANLTDTKFAIRESKVIFLSQDVATPTFITKRYSNITVKFFGGHVPADQGKALLESSGVGFPSGATVRYDASSLQLYVRNTKENLELVDAIISIWSKPPKETFRGR